MRLPSVSEYLHIGLWVLLAIVAYATAGPYSFASCWMLLSLVLLSLPALLVLVVLGVLAILWRMMTSRRPSVSITDASTHLLIIPIGLVGCALSAYLSVGPVSCL